MNSWNPDIIGEWLPLGHRPGYLKHPYSEDFKCSVCGFEQYTLLTAPPNQCPACGAVMGSGRTLFADGVPVVRMAGTSEPVWIGPVVRCRYCRHWQTGIAYETVGMCKHEDHHGQATKGSFYCADGEVKP